MGLDEQRTATLALQGTHHLPGMIRVFCRVGANGRDVFVAQRTGNPDRAVFRVMDIGATTGMRDLGDIDQCREGVFLGIDYRDLVGLVRRRQEIAVRGIPAAVMQEAGSPDRLIYLYQ